MTVSTSKTTHALQNRAQNNHGTGTTVMDLIKAQGPAFKAALPKQIDSERFARIALTAVRTNPNLQKCNPMSFIAALMQSAQLGLEPNTPLGQSYLIPYGNDCQFQLGYQGILTLAYRTGQYQSIYAMPVYAQDEFEYEFGLDLKLIHKPSPEPAGAPVFYYAVYRLANGGHGFAVMSRQEVEMHRDKYSAAAKSGRQSPWKSDFDSMALKTVLKKALKYAPKSVEFAAAMSSDETIKVDLAEDMTEIPTIDVEAETVEAEVNDEVPFYDPNGPDPAEEMKAATSSQRR